MKYTSRILNQDTNSNTQNNMLSNTRRVSCSFFTILTVWNRTYLNLLIKTLAVLFLISLQVECKFVNTNIIKNQNTNNVQLLALANQPVYNTQHNVYIDLVLCKNNNQLLFLNTNNTSVKFVMNPYIPLYQDIKYIEWTKAGVFILTKTFAAVYDPKNMQRKIKYEYDYEEFTNVKLGYNEEQKQVLMAIQTQYSNIVSVFKGNQIIYQYNKTRGTQFVAVQFDASGRYLYVFDRNRHLKVDVDLNKPKKINQTNFDGYLVKTMIANRLRQSKTRQAYPISFTSNNYSNTIMMWNGSDSHFLFNSTEKLYFIQLNSLYNSRYLIYQSHEKLFIRRINYRNMGNLSNLVQTQIPQDLVITQTPQTQFSDLDANQNTIVCMLNVKGKNESILLIYIQDTESIQIDQGDAQNQSTTWLYWILSSILVTSGLVGLRGLIKFVYQKIRNRRLSNIRQGLQAMQDNPYASQLKENNLNQYPTLNNNRAVSNQQKKQKDSEDQQTIQPSSNIEMDDKKWQKNKEENLNPKQIQLPRLPDSKSQVRSQAQNSKYIRINASSQFEPSVIQSNLSSQVSQRSRQSSLSQSNVKSHSLIGQNEASSINQPDQIKASKTKSSIGQKQINSKQESSLKMVKSYISQNNQHQKIGQ